MQFTVVVPIGKKEPLAGVQTGVPDVEHSLVAAGAAKLTTAPHWPGSLFSVMLAGHVSVGAPQVKGVTV